MKQYDVAILGSGLGGLLVATMLAMHGRKAIVLEQNRQIGGNLQTFSRRKQLFDTGVHYIGGLDKGQNLYQLFKYAGIMDELQLKRMDTGFDQVVIDGDEQVYELAQGYDAFVLSLVKYFPGEEKNIMAYCEYIKKVAASYPLYNLSLESEGNLYLANDVSAKEVIKRFTADKKLQQVLAGNNLLYAGGEKTPFHVHALITNSYIESSWKCINGGGEIAKLLSRRIHALGGTIMRNCKVVKLVEEAGKLQYAFTASGDKVYAAEFISNMHPAQTLAMTETNMLRSLYKNRIAALPNSIASFSIHIILKEKTVAYQNKNYYFQKNGAVWNAMDYTQADWPLVYGLYYIQDRNDTGFAAAVSVLTYMRFEEMAPWQDSFNTVSQPGERGSAYEAFKEEKARQVFALLQQRFPDIVENIAAHFVATPITNRDYIGNADGSIYGIQKDYSNPQQAIISPRTKIPNLFLTGQNLNLHGILGTSLSAVLTTVAVLDNKKIVEEIRNA